MYHKPYHKIITALAILSAILLFNGCQAPRYSYHTYTIDKKISCDDAKNPYVIQLLDIIKASGGIINKNPVYYTVFSDGITAVSKSLDREEILKKGIAYYTYRKDNDDNIDNWNVPPIQKQYFVYKGTIPGQIIQLICSEKIIIRLSGNIESFSSEHALFLLRLENNLNKAGIDYQYYYDYVIGSLICPETKTNDMPEEPY